MKCVFCYVLGVALFGTVLVSRPLHAGPKKIKQEVEVEKNNDDSTLVKDFNQMKDDCYEDFSFSKQSTRLFIPDKALQGAIKSFVDFREKNHGLKIDGLLDKFLDEHESKFIEVSRALGNERTLNKPFVEEMVRRACLCGVASDDTVDIVAVIQKKYADFLTEPGVQQPERKKRKVSCNKSRGEYAAAEFSERVIDHLAKQFAYRHLSVTDVLLDDKPSHFPELFWDLLTNVMIPINNCVDSEKPGKTIFEILSSEKINEDEFLSVAVYLMIKVTQTKSFHSSFEYISMALYLHGVALEEGIKWVELSYDAEFWVNEKINTGFNDNPVFESGLNVHTKKGLDKEARRLGVEYNSERPDFIPRSLWIVIMALYNLLNKKVIDKDIPDFRCLLEMHDRETADFFIACLAIVFYYPEIVSDKCRQSIEYWIQHEMIRAKLSHIDWRDEISRYPMPLFFPSFNNE